MELSIIIPVFNAQAHIGRCLESILVQKGSFFEVLVIDDASTDTSLQRICRKAEADSRLRVFRNDTNRLAGYCRNLGMQQACGRFLWFVDADDWISPGSIARLLHWVQEYPEAEVFSFGFMEYYHPNERERFYFSIIPDGRGGGQHATRNFLAMRHGYSSMPFSYWFSRKFLQAQALRFPEGVYFEDLYFMARVFFYNPEIQRIPHIFYTYNRSNASSVTLSHSPDKILDLLKMYSWIRMFYGLHDAPPMVFRLLRTRFLLYGLPRCYRMYLHLNTDKGLDQEVRNALRASHRKYRLKRGEWVSLIRTARALAGQDRRRQLIFYSNLRLLMLAHCGFWMLEALRAWKRVHRAI